MMQSWIRFFSRKKGTNRTVPIEQAQEGSMIPQLYNEVLTIQEAIDFVPDLICVMNRNGNVVSTNARFNEFVDIKSNKQLSAYLTETSVEDFKTAFDDVVSTGNGLSLVAIEFLKEHLKRRGLRKGNNAKGNMIHWELRSNASSTGIMLLGREVLAAKHTRQNDHIAAKEGLVRFQEAMEAKRMFVRCVCHEVRTPLSVVLSGIYLLESLCEPYKDSMLNETIADMKLSCQSAADIMSALLIHEQLEGHTLTLRPMHLDIYKLVEESINSFQAHAKQWDITLSLENTIEGGVMVDGDAEILGVAARTLIDNGIKFALPAGYVTVKLSTVLAGEEGKRWLRISVTDNGPGMTAEGQKLILNSIERFSPTTNETEQGHGAAISVVYGIVDLHHGRMGMSSPGLSLGSTFFVDLPVLESVAAAPEHPPGVKVVNEGSYYVSELKKRKNPLKTVQTLLKMGVFRRKPEGDHAQPSSTKSSKHHVHTSEAESTHSTGVIGETFGRVGKFIRQSVLHSLPMHVHLPHLDLPSIRHGSKSDLDSKRQSGKLAKHPSRLENGSSIQEEPLVKQTSSIDNISIPYGGPSGKKSPLIGYPTLEVHRRLRLLLVDDVPSCRKMLSRLLQIEHCICDEAKDGVEAVQKVQESFASGAVYDGIFMDASMPNMTGAEAAREMRKLGFHNKIYGVTGNSLPEDVDEFLECGADLVKIKPISKMEIQELLCEIKSIKQ